MLQQTFYNIQVHMYIIYIYIIPIQSPLNPIKSHLPSGKLSHNYGKSQFLYNGKIHYFYGNVQ